MRNYILSTNIVAQPCATFLLLSLRNYAIIIMSGGQPLINLPGRR
nr:MAG TPA: hypothetical protein [Caudoviricetes sp.]